MIFGIVTADRAVPHDDREPQRLIKLVRDRHYGQRTPADASIVPPLKGRLSAEKSRFNFPSEAQA